MGAMLRTVRRQKVIRLSSCRVQTMACRRLSHGAAAEAAEAARAPKNEHEAIHVLGVGNLGKYVAHAMASASPKTSNPITLLFHREGLEEQWRAAGSGIRCIMTNGVADMRSGFRVESLLPTTSASTYTSTSTSVCTTPPMPIKYLIVATKTYNTASALSLVRDRLDPESSVLFLQNGMGTMEETSSKVFTDPNTRPAYWAGICSAGVYSTGPFTIVHAGRGPLALGLFETPETPSRAPDTTSASQNLMIQRLLQAGVLETTLLSSDAIKKSQLRKLVVNAVINPLTAVLRCQNGELLRSSRSRLCVEMLVAEIAPVVGALIDADIQASDGGSGGFSHEELYPLVVETCEKTGANTSSMLQDVQAGRGTEIDYINGYVVAQAKRLGLPCRRNELMVELVKRREIMSDLELESLLLGDPQ